MSDQIDVALVEEFNSNVQHLSQQKNQRISSFVRQESIGAEAAFFDQIGSTEANERTTRHGDTVLVNTPHSRRMVVPRVIDWADLIDRADINKVLMNPKSNYVLSAVAAMKRKKDLIVRDAALGTALTGKSGTTSTAFDTTNQQIAASATGLTVAKLREAKKIFGLNDVDEEIPLHIAVGSNQLDDLLATTEVTSSDFNVVKTLVQGEIDTFLGFKFHRYEALALDSSADRRVIAWAEDGLLFAANDQMTVTINQRPDKNNAWQVHVEMDVGATRMEEKKVVEVLCVE